MKIKIIDSICSQGSLEKVNEDLIIKADGLVVVLDGATGIGDGLIKNQKSDAEWFVSEISNNIVESWGKTKNFKLSLQHSLNITNENYKKATSQNNIDKHAMPSAGMIALVVEKNNEISLHQAGDCSLIYKSVDKSAVELSKSKVLEQLDNASIALLQKYIKSGLSYNDSRKKILPLLRLNREKMNTKNGYSVLSTCLDSINYVKTTTFGTKSGDKLLLATDGFDAIYKKYKACQIEDFFNKNSKSLQEILNLLRTIENNDSKLLKYPRLKTHDDATAVLVELK